MKKIIASLLLVTSFALTASAKGKKGYNMKYCPAKTCTDHSYDAALGEQSQSSGSWSNEETTKKYCPAKSCTDHSYDEAFSGSGVGPVETVANAPQPAAPAMKKDMYVDMASDKTMTTTRTKRDTYSMNEFIFHGRSNTGVTRPSAYEGDDAPTYDGAALNAYRNMRVNNTSERLPANNGK